MQFKITITTIELWLATFAEKTVRKYILGTKVAPLGQGGAGRKRKAEFGLFLMVGQGGKDELSLMIVC